MVSKQSAMGGTVKSRLMFAAHLFVVDVVEQAATANRRSMAE